MTVGTFLWGATDPRPTCAAAGSNLPSDVAKEKYNRAARAYGVGKFAEALLLLEEVTRLYSSPNALVLLGHCYLHLGRLASALATYRQAEQDAAAQLAHSPSATLDETRKSALVHMADLSRRVPHVTLVVPSDLPTDFALLLDGKLVPAAQWGTEMPVDPGGHEVAATGTRLLPFKRSLTIGEGVAMRVDVSPERQTSARVQIVLPDGVNPALAELQVNGATQPVTGQSAVLLLEPGRHNIVVGMPQRRTFHFQRMLENGDQVVLHPSFARVTPTWATFAAGAVTIASLVAAIGLGAHAAALDTSDVRQLASSPSANSDILAMKLALRDETRAYATAATTLFVIAGVFGAGSVALGLTADWHPLSRLHPAGGATRAALQAPSPARALSLSERL